MSLSAAVRPARLPIVVAEDNDLDRMILQEAFDEVALPVDLHFVSHGEALLDYLRRKNSYAELAGTPWPMVILMDLNMPRLNGYEALKQIRADPSLCMLPVMMLSTSDNPDQITLAYANGANAYMTKPARFDELVELVRHFGAFWLASARLPTLAVPR